MEIGDLKSLLWFLMLGGLLLGFSMIIRLVSYATPFNAAASNDCVAYCMVMANHSPWEWKAGSMWTITSDLMNLLVFVWGSLVLFGTYVLLKVQKMLNIFFSLVNYKDWTGEIDEISDENYCHPGIFWSSVTLIGAYWIIGFILMIAKCFYVVKSRRLSYAF